MNNDVMHAIVHNEVIAKLAEKLGSYYLFPDVALEMVQMLQRRQAAGEYVHLTSEAEFCLLLTTHLQEVCRDTHLHIQYSLDPVDMIEPGPELEALPPRAQERRYRLGMQNSFGVAKVELLSGNVGYLDLRRFYRTLFVEACEILIAAIQQLVTTSALIIDLRQNTGGSPLMEALLASYFFASPVQLSCLHWRTGKVFQNWTLPYVPGKRYLDKPLYLLLSSRTVSCAEAFAYDLKQLGRATLIGETTRGGAHVTKTWPLNEHIQAMIPAGNALNPITGINWEGCGVAPDVQIASEEALQAAHSLALTASENYQA